MSAIRSTKSSGGGGEAVVLRAMRWRSPGTDGGEPPHPVLPAGGPPARHAAEPGVGSATEPLVGSAEPAPVHDLGRRPAGPRAAGALDPGAFVAQRHDPHEPAALRYAVCGPHPLVGRRRHPEEQGTE